MSSKCRVDVAVPWFLLAVVTVWSASRGSALAMPNIPHDGVLRVPHREPRLDSISAARAASAVSAPHLGGAPEDDALWCVAPPRKAFTGALRFNGTWAPAGGRELRAHGSGAGLHASGERAGLRAGEPGAARGVAATGFEACTSWIVVPVMVEDATFASAAAQDDVVAQARTHVHTHTHADGPTCACVVPYTRNASSTHVVVPWNSKYTSAEARVMVLSPADEEAAAVRVPSVLSHIHTRAHAAGTARPLRRVTSPRALARIVAYTRIMELSSSVLRIADVSTSALPWAPHTHAHTYTQERAHALLVRGRAAPGDGTHSASRAPLDTAGACGDAGSAIPLPCVFLPGAEVNATVDTPRAMPHMARTCVWTTDVVASMSDAAGIAESAAVVIRSPAYAREPPSRGGDGGDGTAKAAGSYILAPSVYMPPCTPSSHGAPSGAAADVCGPLFAASVAVLPLLFPPPSLWDGATDAFRGFIAQRFVPDVGGFVLVDDGLSAMDARPTPGGAGMHDGASVREVAFREVVSQLLHTLTADSGVAEVTLEGRVEQAYVRLYEHGLISYDDVVGVQEFMAMLADAGTTAAPLRPLGPSAFPPGVVLAPPPECPRRVRALVTGISGMIGSHVARRLVTRKCYDVYGLVRPRSNLDTLVGVLDQIQLVIGDLTDAPRMYDLMASIRPDYVYHFGAQAINGISYSVPELTVQSNVQGTLNVLEAIRRINLKCRVLMAGSSTEYGRTADEWDGPIPESAPLQPVSPYGVSKVATENLARQYWFSFQIPSITARLFIQIGVGGVDSLAIHQFCKQIALAEAGIAPPVIEHGNLDTLRDMTDAFDSGEVMVQLAEKGVPGEAYNVGSGQTSSISHLLALAVKHATINITTRADPSRFRVYDEKVLLADISKLQTLTGWAPSMGLEQSVIRILNYWRRKIHMLYDVPASP